MLLWGVSLTLMSDSPQIDKVHYIVDGRAQRDDFQVRIARASSRRGAYFQVVCGKVRINDDDAKGWEGGSAFNYTARALTLCVARWCVCHKWSHSLSLKIEILIKKEIFFNILRGLVFFSFKINFSHQKNN